MASFLMTQVLLLLLLAVSIWAVCWMVSDVHVYQSMCRMMSHARIYWQSKTWIKREATLSSPGVSQGSAPHLDEILSSFPIDVDARIQQHQMKSQSCLHMVELLHEMRRAKSITTVNNLLLVNGTLGKDVALHSRVNVNFTCRRTGATLAHIYVATLARIVNISAVKSYLPTLLLLLPTTDMAQAQNGRGETVLHELMRPVLAPLALELLRDSPTRIDFDWFIHSNAGRTPRQELLTLKTDDNETGYPIRALVEMHENIWFTGTRPIVFALLSHQFVITDVACIVLDYVDGGLPAQYSSKNKT
jgi:hypothetical protein